MIWAYEGICPFYWYFFLADRTFEINWGRILSDVFYQAEGVPQGAILSTTLFNVKINNIVKQVDPGVECSLDVDDFVIMYKSPIIDAIQRKLQLTINRLEKWTLENGFTISKNKTIAMHFCPDKKPPLEIRREKLALQYTMKLKANPENPAYDVVFNPKYQNLYANQDSATDSFLIYCKKLLKESKIDVGEIAINSIPDVPIWDCESVTVDFTISEFDKSSASSTVFKSRFNEVRQKYLDTLTGLKLKQK